MENASKALLMAGGILIALLVIGALVLMFNQIGEYNRVQDVNKKSSQIAEFNLDFERYLDDKGITGADVVSLINKVVDYNVKAQNGGVENSVDYNIKLSITISNLDGGEGSFNKKYAYSNENNKIFKAPSYTIGNDYNKLSNQLKADLDTAREIEDKGISKDQLKQLSGIYDKSDKTVSIQKIHNKLMEIDYNRFKDWNVDSFPTLDAIIKYRQYWEFKTSKFVPVGSPVYQNGQITHMEVKFDK